MRLVDRKIITFIGLAAVLGVLANGLARGIYDFGDNAALALFALFVAALALLAPVWFKGALSKEVVDFWYYLLAMCSVVSFYLYNTVEREKLQVSQSAREARSQIDVLSARQGLIQKMIARPDELLGELRKRATDALEVNEYMRKEQCACAARTGRCFGEPAFDVGDSKDPFKKSAAESKRLAAALVCQDLLDPATDAPWKALASASSLDLLSSRDWTDLDPKRMNSFSSTDQSFRDVVITLARGHKDPSWLSRQSADLAAVEQATRKSLDGYQIRYKNLAGLDAKPELASSRFVGLLWPYIILGLLGLKIARVQYIGLSRPEPTG